jgi:NTE family protein
VPKSIGLALGGGGARGWAHIGVLRALEENNIAVQCIAGTSIGALVGAIYVRDQLHRLESFADDVGMENLMSLMDVSFPGLGLVEGQQVRDFLAGYLVDASFEDCSVPFRCVATNFLAKKEVVFESGSLIDAVRASISMPGVFVPCKHENAYLVDGGVVNPVPVNVVKAMGAEVIVAVNLNHDPKTIKGSSEEHAREPQTRLGADKTNDAAETQSKDQTQSREQEADSSSQTDETPGDSSQSQEQQSFAQGVVNRYENLKDVLQDQIDDWMPDPETGMNIFDVLGNSINMMEQQVTEMRLQSEAPHVLIEPDLMEFGIFDFQQAKPMIQRGYDAAMEKMEAIRAAVGSEELSQGLKDQGSKQKSSKEDW